jgi:RimJ/RimL family protein N-acetyltransferase
MLEGLLVDLVPYDKTYHDLEHKWWNSEVLFWGMGGDRPIVSRAIMAERFKRQAEHRETNPVPPVFFGVQTKAGLPIGYFGAWLTSPHRMAHLGTHIGEPAYWSRGYGTDALTLVIDYLFDWFDLHKLVILTSSMNERVQRQMQKVGFVFEARQRRATLADGVWIDWLNYGLHRTDWPGRAAIIEKLGLKAGE